MLEDLSDAGLAQWRQGMAHLARRPNVVSKLSGLGTFLRRNDPAHIAFVARETLALFGADRCLFGSNFPIEKLWTAYPTLFAAFRDAVPKEARAAVFEATARRTYRLT
jgi:predicted TIM-barrel fold metal-dependent hydrolase